MLCNSHEDHIVWHGEATDEYSVRSGHKLLLQDLQTPMATNIHPNYKSIALQVVDEVPTSNTIAIEKLQEEIDLLT
ncbi:hypothetical protein Gotur_017305 [Gossypium turneri]